MTRTVTFIPEITFTLTRAHFSEVGRISRDFKDPFLGTRNDGSTTWLFVVSYQYLAPDVMFPGSGGMYAMVADPVFFGPVQQVTP
jgi:hypothetical protein